jgi:hypothetical protein
VDSPPTPVEEPDEPWPWWVWAAVFVLYVALGYLLKSIVLNWIVGPLFPLAVLVLLPRLVGRGAR